MKQHDDLTPEEREALDAWPTMTPPAGLAETVLERVSVERRRRRVGWAAAAAVILVAGAGLVWRTLPGVPARGAHIASVRATVEMGERVVAVAEPGATLAWSMPTNGAGQVEQRTGDVFYRVDAGDQLTVTTPLGDVHVLGTCFRVEVIPMKAAAIGALAGAVATAAVLVSVYEGRVTVGADGSRRALEVAAGEAARLSPTDGPTKIVRNRQIAALVAARAAVVGAANRDKAPGFVEVPEDTYAALLEASEAMQARVEELERRLGVEEEMRLEREGKALEPPPDLEDRYKKDAVVSAIQKAIDDSDLPAQITAVDCTEYPCIVFGEAVGERGQAWAEEPRFFDQLMEQPSLAAYGDDSDKRASVWRRLEDGEDGEEPTSTTAFGVSFYPKSDKEKRGSEIDRRLDHRVSEVLDPPGD